VYEPGPPHLARHGDDHVGRGALRRRRDPAPARAYCGRGGDCRGGERLLDRARAQQHHTRDDGGEHRDTGERERAPGPRVDTAGAQPREHGADTHRFRRRLDHLLRASSWHERLCSDQKSRRRLDHLLRASWHERLCSDQTFRRRLDR